MIVKLKSTGDSGRLTPAHPKAVVGAIRPDLIIYEVRDVPPETPLAEVVRLANLGVTGVGQRYSYSWREIR